MEYVPFYNNRNIFIPSFLEKLEIKIKVPEPVSGVDYKHNQDLIPLRENPSNRFRKTLHGRNLSLLTHINPFLYPAFTHLISTY